MSDHPSLYQRKWSLYQREWSIGRLKVRFEWRASHKYLGRFGGGWRWALGFEAGGSTVNLLLLVASLTLRLLPKGDATQKEGGGA